MCKSAPFAVNGFHVEEEDLPEGAFMQKCCEICEFSVYCLKKGLGDTSIELVIFLDLRNRCSVPTKAEGLIFEESQAASLRAVSSLVVRKLAYICRSSSELLDV